MSTYPICFPGTTTSRGIGEAEEPSYRFAEPAEVVDTVELPSDIYEQERELVFQVDVPGMTEKDLDVRIEDQGLVVSGVRPAVMSLGAPQLVERRHGHFLRSYPLPEDFHARIINLDVQKGVLEVVLRNEIEEGTNVASAHGEIGNVGGKADWRAVFYEEARFAAAVERADSDDASATTELPHYIHDFKATGE